MAMTWPALTQSPSRTLSLPTIEGWPEMERADIRRMPFAGSMRPRHDMPVGCGADRMDSAPASARLSHLARADSQKPRAAPAAAKATINPMSFVLVTFKLSP